MEGDAVEEGESSGASEFAPALIAVHPFEQCVAVAVGPELRVFDVKGNSPIVLSDDTGAPSHTDAIRAITYCTNGALFASAGDDKLVKIWKTDSWHCVRTVSSEKRVSAVAISNDGQFVTFADKFGVVWLVSLGGDEGHKPVENKPVPILGHYCSIITSVRFSPDGRFLATADRDFKIRITLLPKRLLKGAHEIQSFCLGHTDFVSCLAFVGISTPPGLLLSGSGDSTVRLWDYINGCLLDTCQVGDKAGLSEHADANVGSSPGPAIADICVLGDGSLAAVAIKGLNGIALLKCSFSDKTLSFAKVFTMEKSYIPTSLSLGVHAQQVWTVMGASNLPGLPTSQPLARLKIVSGFSVSPGCVENEPVVLADSEVPGGEKLLLTFQGSVDAATQEEMLASAAAAIRDSMHNMMVKKQYSVEGREFRKRGRNDKKVKQ